MEPRIEILKFSAPWCEPCKAYSPVVNAWIQEQTDVFLTNIDVESTPDEGSKYRVMSIPTTILLVNGEETKRKVGPMTPSELDDFIK